MLDGLPLGLLGQIGPWGLVTGLFLLLMTGRLVPRSTVERERELLEQRGSEYKEAWLLTEQARKVQAEQLDELLGIARSTAAVLGNREPV